MGQVEFEIKFFFTAKTKTMGKAKLAVQKTIFELLKEFTDRSPDQAINVKQLERAIILMFMDFDSIKQRDNEDDLSQAYRRAVLLFREGDFDILSKLDKVALLRYSKTGDKVSEILQKILNN